MQSKRYKEIVSRNSAKEDVFKNVLISFLIGGAMGVFGEIVSHLFINIFHMSINDSYLYTMVVLVVLGSVLTGLGFFDKVVSFCKCGLIVPTTGFAHAMTSSAMDYRKEGLVKGIGANIFKLTGSIILYGIVAAFFFALLGGLL